MTQNERTEPRNLAATGASEQLRGHDTRWDLGSVHRVRREGGVTKRDQLRSEALVYGAGSGLACPNRPPEAVAE